MKKKYRKAEILVCRRMPESEGFELKHLKPEWEDMRWQVGTLKYKYNGNPDPSVAGLFDRFTKSERDDVAFRILGHGRTLREANIMAGFHPDTVMRDITDVWRLGRSALLELLVEDADRDENADKCPGAGAANSTTNTSSDSVVVRQ